MTFTNSRRNETIKYILMFRTINIFQGLCTVKNLQKLNHARYKLKLLALKLNGASRDLAAVVLSKSLCGIIVKLEWVEQY